MNFNFFFDSKVPAKLREIVTVSERIAKIQPSIFGPGDCVVTNQLGFTDRAYTSLPLKGYLYIYIQLVNK